MEVLTPHCWLHCYPCLGHEDTFSTTDLASRPQLAAEARSGHLHGQSLSCCDGRRAGPPAYALHSCTPASFDHIASAVQSVKADREKIEREKRNKLKQKKLERLRTEKEKAAAERLASERAAAEAALLEAQQLAEQQEMDRRGPCFAVTLFELDWLSDCTAFHIRFAQQSVKALTAKHAAGGKLLLYASLMSKP